MWRKPNCAFSQLVHRMYEHKSRRYEAPTLSYPIHKQQHCQGPVLRLNPNKQFREIVFKDYCVKTNICQSRSNDQGYYYRTCDEYSSV